MYSSVLFCLFNKHLVGSLHERHNKFCKFILTFFLPGGWLVMAQALVDLQYYKCGHCSEKFATLKEFGKHQREKHKPKGAPRPHCASAKEDQEEDICDTVPTAAPSQEEAAAGTPRKPIYQAYIKLKLCKQCLDTFCLVDQNKVQVVLCNSCLEENGLL